MRLDYEDPDSQNLIILVDYSKGVRKMFVSKDYLVKDSCGQESFKIAIETTNKVLITILRSYIQGHVTLKKASPSPIKVAPKKIATQSRPTKIESSSATDDEEAWTTPGAELASGVLPSE